ncbi:TonB-dependent receptor domain-containing protein, partial [Phocaeicola vulgatus]
SLDAAYYVKTTKDDIVQVTTSGASGFESAIQNVGEIRNNGVEVMVNAVPVHTKDFNWNSTFNIAYNSSDVKYLGIDGTGE